MEEEAFSAGTLAGAGSFRCEDCGFVVTLSALDEVPACPNCDSRSFARASMFLESMTPESPPARTGGDEPDWLAGVRSDLREQPGHYLAFDDGERVTVFPLTREWTRIGRSLAADVRFDDPTVSRRHAIVVRQSDGVRLLDDRSLNGVFVNGERVEWCGLSDGDRIIVGRYEFHFVDSTATAMAESATGERALVV